MAVWLGVTTRRKPARLHLSSYLKTWIGGEHNAHLAYLHRASFHRASNPFAQLVPKGNAKLNSSLVKSKCVIGWSANSSNQGSLKQKDDPDTPKRNDEADPQGLETYLDVQLLTQQGCCFECLLLRRVELTDLARLREKASLISGTEGSACTVAK
jgi:hypothetical protein